MPLHRRIPKRGFTNIFRVEYDIVNLSQLDVFDGQLHTFQMAAGRSPVADEAIGRLAAWVRPKLGL